MNYFNYYTEIEETFVRRRGKNLLLSPIDWALIENWQERGIPLHIALRAIENVFDGYDKKPSSRTIKGLLYCREEIEAQYEEWLRSQAGKAEVAPEGNGGLSATDAADHIGQMIERLKGVAVPELAEDLARVISRLEALRTDLNADLANADKSLADIEHFLDNALLTNSNKLHLKQLEKEVALHLKPYRSSMDDDAFANTFQLMLLKRVREEYGIPRLTLLYL